MSETKINAALVTAYLASGVMPQARTAFEGVTFTPATSQSWARLTNVPTDRSKSGLTRESSSVATGILQIDLFWPLNTGTGPILAAADALLAYFEPRQRFAYQSQEVEIRRAERSKIRPEDVWQGVSVDVYYLATLTP